MKALGIQCVLLSLILVGVSSIGFTQSDDASDPAKLAADQAACEEQAKTASGFDPSASSSTTNTQRGSGLRGAARGAAKGAIAGGTVEAITDDRQHDNAAEIGASVGAVSGGLRGRRQARQDSYSTTTGDATAYTNYYNACMKSKGY